MKGRYLKFVRTGPGGMKCTCCFPPPGSRKRKLKMRQARIRELREARKMEEANG